MQRQHYGETGQVLPPGIIDAAQKPPDNIDDAILAAHAKGDQAALSQLLGLKRQMEAAGRAPAGPDNRNPIAVMGPDGKPVFVRPSEAIGKTPASNREQGRPVTSGDAGRIADLDTSLNDLDTLETEIKGMTGTGSAIGAGLPNAVTDLTGIGADSKKRQAVINRVKQVIGKALEGGVLRKEDEEKYKAILPVIGDEPSVAAAKLEGLRQAIEQRRGTTLDSLDDAGYEVGEYRKRKRPEKKETPEQRAKRLYDELSR